MKTGKSTIRTTIRFISAFALAAVIVLLSNCGRTGKGKSRTDVDTTKGLKDFYKDYFAIGVSVGPRDLVGDEVWMLKKNFNSLTAESAMKPGPLQPEENKYFWDDADKIVNFAQENGMKVRGHTLVWHSQAAEWMFKDAKGNPATKELALARLKEHITTVVSRYKGKVYAWDVVNEAVENDSTYLLRKTQWYKICGEDFLAKAFQWAHEADPNAILFYNDYNTENPVKREKIYTLLKKLLDAGVPVHGMGLQGHWNIGNPSEEAIRESIKKFSSLGLKIQITELDVSIYTSRGDTAVIGFTPEREQKQIDFYNMVFKAARENKDVITGVTFWNVSDRRSWLDRRARRKTYPLLFDTILKPKKAYWEVVKF
jgi:endo-1,4-beta-xylanase